MSGTPGTVQLGTWVFPPVGSEGIAVCSWTSSAKIDEKEGDGTNDARTTYKGRQVGVVKIALRWKEKTPADEYAVKMLKDISPRGTSSGKPFEIVASDQDIHEAHSVIVKTIEGPVRTPGLGEASATITCSTWTKPTSYQRKTAVTKTPASATSGGKKSPSAVNLVADPPGFLNDATQPKVLP